MLIKYQLDIFEKKGMIELPIDINLSLVDIILPLLIVLILTQLSTASVVVYWSVRNKFVAEKLQGL